MQTRERFAGTQDALEGFFASLPLGAMVFDRAGTILTVNSQQLANSGVPTERLVGKTLHEAFAGVMQRYGLEKRYRMLVDEGRPFNLLIDSYEPEYLRKRFRLHLWGFAVVPGRTFAILTEGIDLVRAQTPPEIIGTGARMDAVYRFIERAARVSTTVLLCGESGTGKELVARAVHARSGRARKPFLALNCAALPGSLLESTLFGAEKGAFTGADRRTKGYFEAAEGGTLLLDEVGETTLELQAKLLRVLQDGGVTRLGGTEPLHTDVHVICATNRDLDAEVLARRFREDLYFRINILRIELPPLRERLEDLPLLTQHFLDEFDRKHHLGRKHVTPEVLDTFLAYRWPGNVRELANVLEAAYVTNPEEALGLDHLPNRIREVALLHPKGHFQPHPYREALERFRREYAAQVLACAGGDVRKAARLAGVDPSTLYRLGGRSGRE